MNKLKTAILLAVLFMLVSVPGVRAENDPGPGRVKVVEQEQKPIKHVFFIIVDSLSDKALKSAYTPNINGLAVSGVQTTAIGVLPANSEAYIASLLTGADPSVHGLIDDKSRLKTLSLPQIISKYGRTSVFISKAGSTPGAIIGSGENIVQNVEIKTKSNGVLIDKAIKIFNQKQPYFFGVRLIGAESNKAAKAQDINAADEQIGRLLAAVRANGVYDQCMFVVTGNYKNINNLFNQTGNIEDIMVPVIMTGPGLKSGAVLPPAKISDVAPTVALLTGIQISPESDGLVMWNALRPGTGFIEENLLLKRVKDLSEENIKSIGSIYRLHEEKGIVKVEKENVAREKSIMQKTVYDKDTQIKSLKRQIGLLKLLEIASVAILGVGYVVEYFYLKKKFLMF